MVTVQVVECRVEHTFAAFLDCEVQRGDELGSQTIDVRTQVYQRTRRIAVSLLARAVQRRGALERVKIEGFGGGVSHRSTCEPT